MTRSADESRPVDAGRARLEGLVEEPEAERARRVQLLRRALNTAQADSDVRLRGSLARGTADEWSDIDLAWTVDDGDRVLTALPDTLRTVGPVESLRLDPDLRVGGRLVFVRFAGWPLFQRVDLEIFGRFAGRRPGWAGEWSAAESALMNAVAAVRAAHRGRGDVDGLIGRALERVGGRDPGGTLSKRLRTLIDAAVAKDPTQGSLADRIRAEVLAAIEEKP